MNIFFFDIPKEGALPVTQTCMLYQSISTSQPSTDLEGMKFAIHPAFVDVNMHCPTFGLLHHFADPMQLTSHE